MPRNESLECSVRNENRGASCHRAPRALEGSPRHPMTISRNKGSPCFQKSWVRPDPGNDGFSASSHFNTRFDALAVKGPPRGDSSQLAATRFETARRALNLRSQAPVQLCLAVLEGDLSAQYHSNTEMMNDWMVQVAWMQVIMMAQMGWPLPNDAAGGAEEADDEEQENFFKIDITAELLKITTDALGMVAKATQAADCLRAQLAYVKYTLEYVFDTIQFQFFKDSDSDYLESRAARALDEVDELLRQQATKEAPPLPAAAVEYLRLLQRHLQDVALLACSRFLDPTVLQSKGIHPDLLARLEAAFGQAALQDDSLWSRLGNSKYHVFTPGLHFGERKHRHGRGGRKSRRSQSDTAEDEASTETGNPATSSAASSSADLPAATTAAPARVTTTSDWESALGEPMRIPVPPTSIEPPAKNLKGGAALAGARTPADFSWAPVRTLETGSWEMSSATPARLSLPVMKTNAATAASTELDVRPQNLGEQMTIEGMSIHVPDRMPENTVKISGLLPNPNDAEAGRTLLKRQVGAERVHLRHAGREDWNPLSSRSFSTTNDRPSMPMVSIAEASAAAAAPEGDSNLARAPDGKTRRDIKLERRVVRPS